jgi:MATE family multidrug resistance protein
MCKQLLLLLLAGDGDGVDSAVGRLWLLAWPLSWMEVLTFAKELIITSYVGHLGAAELSALVLAQTVYNVTGNAP